MLVFEPLLVTRSRDIDEMRWLYHQHKLILVELINADRDIFLHLMQQGEDLYQKPRMMQPSISDLIAQIYLRRSK